MLTPPWIGGNLPMMQILNGATPAGRLGEIGDQFERIRRASKSPDRPSRRARRAGRKLRREIEDPWRSPGRARMRRRAGVAPARHRPVAARKTCGCRWRALQNDAGLRRSRAAADRLVSGSAAVLARQHGPRRRPTRRPPHRADRAAWRSPLPARRQEIVKLPRILDPADVVRRAARRIPARTRRGPRPAVRRCGGRPRDLLHPFLVREARFRSSRLRSIPRSAGSSGVGPSRRRWRHRSSDSPAA